MSIKGVDEVPIFLYSGYPGTELYDELIFSNKIKLNDNFFLSLTSINSNYFSTNISTFSNSVNDRLLSFVRFFAIHLNYLISYLLFPKRIYRTIRLLVFRKGVSTTVLESRLNDLINKFIVKYSN